MWTGPVHNEPVPEASVSAETDFPGPGSRTWRPAVALVIGLLVFGIAAAVATVLPREPLDRLISGLVAVVLLAIAAMEWRRRLSGGPRGLVIAGLTGSRLVPWSTVREVRTGRTKRMGAATLEIDLLDDELIVLGQRELGTDPAAVAAVLQPWFDDRPRR